MRFFSGTRSSNDKSKAKASQVYKDRMEARAKGLPDPDPNEVYKKAIEERMAKMMEEYVLGMKKNSTTLPGTKSQQDDSKPREIPKTTQMMLKMLALKREAKSRKEKKSREIKIKRDMKQKQWEENQLKLQEENQRLQKEREQREYLEEQARLADPNKSWW